MATRLRNRILCALAGALFLLPAAATVSADDDELRSRVEAYWQARAEHSQEVSKYYPPGEAPTETVNVTYSNPVLKDVSVDGDKAVVKVQARADFPMPPQFAGRLPESALNPLIAEAWERIDGVWYKSPIKGGIGRFNTAPKKPIPGSMPTGETGSAAVNQPPASDTGAQLQ